MAPERQHFRLYVFGDARASEEALRELTTHCERSLPEGSYVIEVVDASKDPVKCAADNILVVPTLIRVEPAPRLRLIGELRDSAQLARALRLEDR